MIAKTLMPANQYSNSPYDPTENEVGRGHQDHQHEREDPQRRVEPEGEDLRACHSLEADDDHPEVPVEPGHREARPTTECAARVVRERAGRRVGRRHLAEHPHHQDDQDAGDQRSSGRPPVRVSLITTPDPTNNPAPITPPIAIMVRCRCFSPVSARSTRLMLVLTGLGSPARPSGSPVPHRRAGQPCHRISVPELHRGTHLRRKVRASRFATWSRRATTSTKGMK